MWAKMTNNWQVFALSGEAPKFSGTKALPASPRNPNNKTSSRGTPTHGTQHAIPPAGSIQSGVGMPCMDPGSQIPNPLLISDNPLQHSFTEIGRNACRPREKIVIWLPKASPTAGLKPPGTAIYWQNLKPHVADLAQTTLQNNVILAVVSLVLTAVTAPDSSSCEKCWGSQPRPGSALLPPPCPGTQRRDLWPRHSRD